MLISSSSSVSRLSKISPVKNPPFNPRGPCHACFFVNREKGFEGGVGNVCALEHGEDACHPDAVVRTQRGAVGPHPIAVDEHADAFGHEVKIRGFVFLANHVHVALENHRLSTLHSWS